MKKVGFIGGADKTNIIMYVAKVLDDIDKRVLVIDTSIVQRLRYVLPTINPTRSYITTSENVDYAIGFESMQELLEYLRIENEEQMQYDYVLLDLDRVKAFEAFGIEDTENNYFVTTFDMYSLQRGVKILKDLPNTMNLSKILLDYNMKKEDEEYLNYLTSETKIMWNEFSIYMPIVNENEEIIEENQREYKTKIKRLLPEYQEGILYVVKDIVKDMSIAKIKKMIKD